MMKFVLRIAFAMCLVVMAAFPASATPADCSKGLSKVAPTLSASPELYGPFAYIVENIRRRYICVQRDVAGIFVLSYELWSVPNDLYSVEPAYLSDLLVATTGAVNRNQQALNALSAVTPEGVNPAQFAHAIIDVAKDRGVTLQTK